MGRLGTRPFRWRISPATCAVFACADDFQDRCPWSSKQLTKGRARYLLEVMQLTKRYRRVTGLTRLVLLIVLLYVSYNVLSADAFVRILTPSDGATLTAKGPNTLSYEAVTGASKGNHVHVYVDGKEVTTLHHLKGNYSLKGLTPGTREICVKVANKAHVPIGVDHCIQVTVE